MGAEGRGQRVGAPLHIVAVSPFVLCGQERNTEYIAPTTHNPFEQERFLAVPA